MMPSSSRSGGVGENKQQRLLKSDIESLSNEIKKLKTEVNQLKAKRNWLERVKKHGLDLEYAPYEIRKDKNIVMTAVKNDKSGRVLEFASPELRMDEEVVMAAVQKNSKALDFAPVSIRDNKNIVMAAVQKNGEALEFASPKLQNDKEVVTAAIENDKYGRVLQFASPELCMDKEVFIAAFRCIRLNPKNIRYASNLFTKNATSPLRNGKSIVIEAIRFYGGSIFKDISPELQSDKEVVLIAVEEDPDNIKYVNEDLKHDPDVLIAADMYDDNYDAKRQQSTNTRKIALSTRFSLNSSSTSQATNFTSLFKNSSYIQKDGNFIIYAPNAFDKKTCDPEWTNFDHPCRGTKDTCEYNNVLTDTGRPTDDCCWRYSFRSQLQEAKDSCGFMLQLIEMGDGKKQELGKGQTIELDIGTKLFQLYRPRRNNGSEVDFGSHHIDVVTDAISRWYGSEIQELGKGQTIELDMANFIGTKVFQVYRPRRNDGREVDFGSHHIDVVTDAISRWYGNQCRDMSVTVIRPTCGPNPGRSNFRHIAVV